MPSASLLTRSCTRRQPLNAEPPREALAGAPITPIERFYVRNHGPVPENTGALRIDGLVRDRTSSRSTTCARCRAAS